MGKLVDWSFEAKGKHPCSSCGMETKDGCCKEEAKHLKIATDQKPSSSFVFKALENQFLPANVPPFPEVFNFANGFHHQPSNNGPPTHAIAIHKYLRVFRI